MRPNISIYQSAIRAALSDSGWEIVSCEELDAWWCHESWRLSSLWAPHGFRAFVTFLIDPQSETQQLQRGEYRVWAAKASPDEPSGWQETESELTLALNGKWQQRIPELIAHLNQLRSA